MPDTPPGSAAIPTCDDANCEGVGTDHIGPCNLNDEDPCYLDPECEHPRHDPSSHPCGPRLAEGASTPGLPSWVLPDEGDKAVPAAPPASPPPPGSAALTGWRRRRAEARLIRLERRLRNLDKHASWETSFDRWGPAQDAKYDRDRAALIDSLNGLCTVLGVEHAYR